MSEQNNKFSYSYSAPTEKERKEVESLRGWYTEEKEPDKLAQLKKLDDKVKRPPEALALSLGVVGTLIFGGGMAMILKAGLLVWGALVSLVGLVPLALAYPLYKQLLKKLKDKYRDEILRLSDEILHEDEQ